MAKRILGILFLLVTIPATPVPAQLAQDRIDRAVLPLRPGPHLQTGPGTVRLAGMGGFETAILDENLEYNLWDFNRNPAAFGDDRDSWAIDLRYTHNEYIERDPLVSPLNDIRTNEGSLLLGFYSPRKLGAGGRLDYAEVASGLQTEFENNFKLAGLELAGNLYLAPWLSAGLSLGQMSESERAFSSSIYNINHDGSNFEAGLGLMVHPARGITLGVRGEAATASVDGESRGPFHTDTFTWDRPQSLVSIAGILNRGRLRVAADFTRRNVEGEESVEVSWSERFIRNPTDDFFSMSTGTFSEDRQVDRTTIRGRLDVIPRTFSLSFGRVAFTEDFDVKANPNMDGSRGAGRIEAEATATIAGFAWKLFDRRLLFAGEAKLFDTETVFLLEGDASRDAQDGWTARLGGEYLLSETLAGRAGIIHEQVGNRLESFRPYLGDPFATNDQITAVAIGLGLVPSGAIWQLDVSYEVVVNSDVDTDRSSLGAYLRYLF